MTEFIADIRQWHTALEFERDLSRIQSNDMEWAQAIVLHHTRKPLPTTWRGARSLELLIEYYHSIKHRLTGPHLYIVNGAMNAFDDGIWQLTPLQTEGVSMASESKQAIGVEIVGNYDRIPWPPATKRLLYDVLQALLRKLTLGPCDVYGHHELGGNSSCPGNMIVMRQVRLELADEFKLI